MSTPARRRRSVAAASLVLLVPVLAACGFNYQTDQVYQPAEGVNNRSGEVDVLNAVVVSGIDERGTMVASLSNENEEEGDALTSVTAAEGEADLTTRLAAPVEIGPGELVNLADVGAVSVTGPEVIPGAFVRLVLEFESGQESELNMPVVAQRGAFADIDPAEASPTASPTP